MCDSANHHSEQAHTCLLEVDHTLAGVPCRSQISAYVVQGETRGWSIHLELHSKRRLCSHTGTWKPMDTMVRHTETNVKAYFELVLRLHAKKKTSFSGIDVVSQGSKLWKR